MGFTIGGGNMMLNGCASSYNAADRCGLTAAAIAASAIPSGIGASLAGWAWSWPTTGLGVISTWPSAGYLCVQNNDHYRIWAVNQANIAFSSTICYIWAQNNGLGLGVRYDLVLQNLALFSSNPELAERGFAIRRLRQRLGGLFSEHDYRRNRSSSRLATSSNSPTSNMPR